MPHYLAKETFQDFLVDAEISRLDKTLLLLYWQDESAKSVSRIKEVAAENGLRECSKWNISDILGRSIGKATSIKGKWVLTASGRNYLLAKNYLEQGKSHVIHDVKDLKEHLAAVSNPQTKSFLQEAINCLEADQKRAAVVFSWVGAIAVLYDLVVKNHLSSFNAEAIRKDAKWKVARNTDDLAKMKEFDFLNILESISVIGKNVKQELQQSLQLRNGCGHPNSLNIGFRRVSAHIEILILNVFSKF